jgi:MFS family permease
VELNIKGQVHQIILLALYNTKMKTSKILYVIVKIVITVVSSFSMLFAIALNMLSKEQLDKLIAENFWSFFFTKFLFGLTVGLIFYLLSLLTNLIFRKRHQFQKQTIFRLALIELAYCIIFSATVTTIIIYSI